MERQSKQDLYALLHEVSMRIARGPRQGYAVKPGQNKVLKLLDKNGSMHQRELLDELGVRPGSLSELLRKMENEGYITRHRNESNRTEMIVDITEMGRVSAMEHRLSMKERDESLFGSLSDQDRADLVRILNKLLDDWAREEDGTEGERRDERWREVEKIQNEQRTRDQERERSQARAHKRKRKHAMPH